MLTLVTGAGLIGCRTAALLAARGEPVALLDLRPDHDALASVPGLDAVQLETGDVRDRASMRALFERLGVTRVLHTAAALSMAIRRDPTLAADVNFGGTVNLLEAARATGVQRFVLASSTTLAYPIFARPHTAPIPEDFAFHVVGERPGSLYAASKLAAEFFVQHYADQFALSVGILRYSAVLGLWAGPNNSVPGRLLATLLGQGAVDGEVTVSDPLLLWSGGDDFIDARDVALANVAALDAARLPSRVYTIGSGKLTHFHEFVAAARQVRPDLRHADVVLPSTGFAGFAHQRDQPFDVGLARRELGFSARHDLLDSMREAAQRMASRPDVEPG
ncbi:MAG: NAD-dependent epimerase/dehydratase family protein [Burkholderiaceae bacterium]